MKADTIRQQYGTYRDGDRWQQCKPGFGAIISETTVGDEMELCGATHDMTTMDPADLLDHFRAHQRGYRGWVL